MGVFTYVYYSSLIRQHNVTVGSILQKIVSGLSVDDQLELILDLKKYLEGMGVQVPCWKFLILVANDRHMSRYLA